MPACCLPRATIDAHRHGSDRHSPVLRPLSARLIAQSSGVWIYLSKLSFPRANLRRRFKWVTLEGV